MLVALKKMRRGDKFIYDGLLCTFLGFVKEKHWYEYRSPMGFCYHIDVRTSDLRPLHNMLVEKITDQLLLF